MEIERQYVDSHGQSEVAFAFCRLLGFQLLPRLKAIAAQRLHLPEAGGASLYPNLACILAKTIDWDLIEQQYDEMVRYTTALAERTADPEAILRRFTPATFNTPPTRRLPSWVKRQRPCSCVVICIRKRSGGKSTKG